MEQWKEIKGYEGYYEVSNTGLIKSSKGIRKVRKRKYISITLVKQGVFKTHTVHRLVAIAFIENPNNYECVMHIDNNPHNNCVDNLQWGTYQMNNKQTVLDGRWKNGYS
jgi:hypothetical protein